MLSGLLDKITSVQNPQVKGVVRLRNKRERDETKTFLIEGYRELLRALSSSTQVFQLFICEELFLKDNEASLIKKWKTRGALVIPCDLKVFQKMSYRDRPDGLLAVAKQPNLSLEDLVLPQNPLLVVAVSIEKPGNLGTILRSADAVGANATIVVDKVTDIYNPNVVRASVGTLFTQPVVQTSTKELFDFLNVNNIQVIATSPGADKVYTQISYSGPTAILVGSEQYGLPPFWLERAHKRVFIPMQGEADSLNAATSTTVILYEALRQRHTF